MRVLTEVQSVHTRIPSPGPKRSWRSYPRRVIAGNKNTPSMQHPRRRNVTTAMVGLKYGHIRKNLTHTKMKNPRDIAGDAVGEEDHILNTRPLTT